MAGDGGIVLRGAGEGASRLITGGVTGCGGACWIIDSSSSSELSSVRSITGALEAAGADELVVVPPAD